MLLLSSGICCVVVLPLSERTLNEFLNWKDTSAFTSDGICVLLREPEISFDPS
jgi:hypothetical protein